MNACRPRLFGPVVEKCIASTRTSTKQKALDILLMYVQVENSADAVVVSISG